jgi:hypothetical protein
MVRNKCGNINFPKPTRSDETWVQRPKICFLGRVGDIWIIWGFFFVSDVFPQDILNNNIFLSHMFCPKFHLPT